MSKRQTRKSSTPKKQSGKKEQSGKQTPSPDPAASLEHVLAALPEDVLRWVVTPQWRIDPGLPRKDLERAVATAAQEQDLRERVAALPMATRRLLRMIAVQDAGIPLARLVGCYGNREWKLSRDLHQALMRLFVVNTKQDALAVPVDLRPGLRQALGIDPSRKPEPGEAAKGPTRDPIAELAAAYAFALRRGMLRLTKNGSIYRTETKRFAKETQGEDYTDEDLDHAERVLMYAGWLGLLVDAGGNLVPSKAVWERLTAAPRDEILALMVANHLHSPSEVAGLNALASLRPGHWYDAEETLPLLADATVRKETGPIATVPILRELLEGPLESYALATVEQSEPDLPGLDLDDDLDDDEEEEPCAGCGRFHDESMDDEDEGLPAPIEQDLRTFEEMLKKLLQSGPTDALDEHLGFDPDPDEEFFEELDLNACTGEDGAMSGTPKTRFAVSERLAAVARILRGEPVEGEAAQPCLVVNPDFEAVLMTQEPPPRLIGLLVRWGTPKAGTPVWRLERRPVQPLTAEELAPYLQTPLPKNVARTLGEAHTPAATRIIPSILVEGDRVEELLRDPEWSPHLELIAPGIARVALKTPDLLNKVTRKIEPGAPKWTNLRLLGELLQESTPPLPAIVEHYGHGAEPFANDLGVRVHAKTRDPWEAMRKATKHAKSDGHQQTVLRVELPRPPRLSAKDRETLLVCYRALLDGSPIEAEFDTNMYWSRERFRGLCHVMGVQTTTDWVTVMLKTDKEDVRYQVNLNRLKVKPSRQEAPLAPESSR